MAEIMQTTLNPSKLEVLTQWMRAQPWYAGAMSPHLDIVGGFRLDDPDGEVGLEFFVVRDSSDGLTYFLPVTYRDAPLRDGESENSFVGTMEHGVLGTRYVYDGPADPVWRTTVAALISGDAAPQHRTESNTEDASVTVVGEFLAVDPDEIVVIRRPEAGISDGVNAPWAAADGSTVVGTVLRVGD